jgi:hypothetical protein
MDYARKHVMSDNCQKMEFEIDDASPMSNEDKEMITYTSM